MYQEERLISIIDYVKEHKRISVEQICSLFQVSRDTARRDLVKLKERGAIIRTRGGAILPTIHDEIKDYSGRLEIVSEEKNMIGKAAASLIREGDHIIFDASTTVQACAEHLPDISCTIITNSINQAEVLSSRRGADIHLLGGKLQKEHRFLYGASVIEKLSGYHVDKAFIGVVGVSDKGLTIAHEEDGMVKRKMISQAKQVIALADHSKIGRTDFFRYAGLSDIDLLITDRLPVTEFQRLLDQHGVELLVAEQEGT
ncbi:DeoR/GlpR family DNA-binding transcription regulator [Bacillus sonorensis]|uniref:HTH-type transcriptional repressor GlcR n=2 Tax=Bacillus sonorensis TaxID=119858 RepID=M5PC05_9BACI|nr:MULTISPECIES: DeoR/GlpR family DNA-binding transcription regulator [Bacillus]TWK80627.1 HTH-type transcriptional repressor GlcR [Bacillus paralicheniformis]EME73430.1 HTH-type transcriptional repressor GlcR [Bacillus sonorensis L12]MCZ0072760.1 DeoR/GlpR family DNA-binding transcription regulator [Bacillus sonorensis]MCZ0091381.1 DeoR/GlpR family DNA-binding transcription regulator [Bacillus sonorensis]MDR4957720.1 DeoR/GlpR family DNA-binding transcription regulator [Bacillus sonorensis]